MVRVPVLQHGDDANMTGMREFTSSDETAQAYLQVLLRDLDDAIICTTADGIVRIWNPGAERLFGYASKELIDRRMDLFGNPRSKNMLPSTQALGPIEKYNTIAIRKDDTPIEISLTICPIRDGTGESRALFTWREGPW